MSRIDPRPSSFSDRVRRLALVPALTLFLGVAPGLQPMAAADGGGTIAAAAVVIEALGLLTTWINGKDDNCAAAALAAVWGPGCGLTKDECTDTGFYSATCSEEVSNGCGSAEGEASSSESPVGMWAGYTAHASASASATKPEEGKNGARGWAKATVDGTSKAKTRGSGNGSSGITTPGGTKGASSRWPRGTVLAVLHLDDVTLLADPGGNGTPSYQGTFQVDGQTVWSASASLDAQGTLSVSGSLSPNDFSVSYDSADNLWTASLSGYRYEHYVGWLDPDAAASSGATRADELTVHVHYETEVESEGDAEGDLTVVPVDVTLHDATLIDNFGIPAFQGQTVHIAEPLVTFSDAAQLGRFLDTDAGNDDGGIGLLDLRQDAVLRAGDQLFGLTGTVYHDDGRTVLVDVEAEVASGGAVPAARSLFIGEALAQAEELEGTLVQLRDLSLVDAASWPGASRSGTALVADSSGEVFTLAIPLASGIGGSAPPAGPFDAVGILTQDDPEAPYHEGYQLRLRSGADLRADDAVPADEDRLHEH